ncbi:putative Zinc finger C-x8-C-x5-C-x3-H type (and similar)/CCCH-type zinc finger containing protein [Leishmania utingensis]|uniref:Zinc finger C-x8-C-x5-C-x3-H type (And similar)/CCCH-type zinc finger containing protein n=1 Tax=Leishmania utingensis TaxID=653362 RepID=A0AAW3A545_9TRYP
MQISRIPSYEEASMAGADYTMSPMSPLAHLSKKIDVTKLKTKACRYFVLGVTCPFGDSCAFSHSEPVSPAAYAPGRMSAKSPVSLNFEDLSKSGSGHLSDTQSNDAAGEVTERVVFGQPPPAYEIALRESETLAAASAAAEELSTPPAYPKRFRFDPYSVNWIAYEKTA